MYINPNASELSRKPFYLLYNTKDPGKYLSVYYPKLDETVGEEF